MAEKINTYGNIPKEKFAFAHSGEKLTDRKFDDKSIGYFTDAWIRFRKNRASVIAAVIIMLVILYAFLAPLLLSHESSFMVAFYAKKPPRNVFLRELGICDGGMDRDFTEKSLIKAIGIGIGAEDFDGHGATLEEGMASYYQPILEVDEGTLSTSTGKKESLIYSGRIDSYLETGFMYLTIEQPEYEKILSWERETGIHVLYPLVENNEWNADPTDANNWYKTKKNSPVTITDNGRAKTIEYGPGMVLEDNYKRDSEGNLVYYEYAGGGTLDSALYKVRILYYNYYRYLYDEEPNYLLGTDSQGYDLAVRMADGIKLSILVALCVSAINLVIGAVYGAVEGYYGGTVDIVLERISDILGGVPFIVVATLFQIHLSQKVGAIPSLLFAFVLTGWLGTAYRVRSQFYRFKNQEYVMAARTLGAKDRRIIWKHIFPNSLGTIITSCALVIPGVINQESTLSFLGIVKFSTAKTTSLGTLLSDASGIWTNYPHLMIYPALFLALLMICFNLFGNGLRDAFNPALRGVEE